MSSRRRSLIALLMAAFVLMAATPALGASSANPVIADCLAHPGGLTGHYTVAQLKNALQVMPAETKEYTSCPDVINRALLAAVGTSGTGTGSSSGGSSSFLPTPVIVILVILILAAVTFGALAVRRRRAAGGGGTADTRAGTGAAGADDPAGPGTGDPGEPGEPADEDLTGPR